jgi:leucine dehydrogenase
MGEVLIQKNSIFGLMVDGDFEELVFVQDRFTGLKGIVAIHDTTLGPALGGTRMWNYKSEMEAIEDAAKLSRAMTLKAAAAGLNYGGGKAVIICDPADKSEELLRVYGRFIETLGGRYVTAEDIGTTVEDMKVISSETEYVTGVALDPSPFTAHGVFHGIKACVKHVFGDSQIDGYHVAVQGAGKVGMALIKELLENEVTVTMTDIDPEKIKKAIEMGAGYVEPEKIYSVSCDIFSPCALGGIIDEKTVRMLNCKIIAGGANNQLKNEKAGLEVAKRGILYAPDFVINAGGLIAVACEYDCKLSKEEVNENKILREVEGIASRLEKIFSMSQKMEDGTAFETWKAAELFAMDRIKRIENLKKMYLQRRK